MHSSNSKINVGIDAKWFFDGPPSGNMVVKNLVDEMISNNAGRFNLFLLIAAKHRKQAEAYFPASVKLVTLPNFPNLISNLFLVPIAALQYKLKVILFQNFTSTWPAKLFKIAYIHDVLFLDYPEYYSKPEVLYFKQMTRLALKADSIITISATEKERLIANSIADEKRINVVYHGINDGFKPLTYYAEDVVYSAINKYNLPNRYLLFVGRVNIRKNLLNLIKALGHLDDNEIPLLIVGEKNNLYADLQKYIDDNSLQDRVSFKSHVPEKDLQLIYACATVFCFPSFAEGFGLPPLEAMKCGVPVVVSNRTAMPEICGDAAVYFDPEDSLDIACAINELLNDPELYNDKIKKGFQRADTFVWSNSARQILTLIEKANVN